MSTKKHLHRSNCGQMAERKWSDLPSELLSPIADGLGLIELLRFRGVCKDWKSASATASAEIESLPDHEPWFLVYGENSECLLISNSGKKYSINIPELNGTTCLASNQGWLLMFHEGSMFFFCPFSHAKIDLPKFPHSKVTDHVAAFSSPPTSQDCVVAVINKDETNLELNMLYRGAKAWISQKCTRTRGTLLKIFKGATYLDGTFYFFDSLDMLVTFSVEDQKWNFFVILPPSNEKSPDIQELKFDRSMSHFIKRNMKEQLGLPDNVSISTCGTLVHDDYYNKVVLNENIEAAESKGHKKGVWMQPRFFQVSPNQTW